MIFDAIHDKSTFGFLLMYGLNTSIPVSSNGGKTILHHVASLSSPGQFLGLLVDFNVDLDVVYSLGNTALHEAAQSNLLDNIKTLIDGVANPTIANLKDETAMQLTQDPSIRRYIELAIQEWNRKLVLN